MVKIDFLNSKEYESKIVLDFISNSLIDSPKLYFYINIVEYSDTPTSDTLIVSPSIFFKDIKNLNKNISFLNQYRNLIFLIPLEDVHIDAIHTYIVPYLIQLNKNILWIGSQPDIHTILKQFGVENVYEFPLDGLMYTFKENYFFDIPFIENREFLLKTYLMKSKWWRDAIFILQNKIFLDNKKCKLNYTGGTNSEYETDWYNANMNSIFKETNFNFDDIKFEIKKQEYITESNSGLYYDLSNTMFFILNETYNNFQINDNRIPANNFLPLSNGNLINKDEYIYSLTEKTILPLVNGNIFYDFSFMTNTSKFIKKYGFETFYDDNSFGGLYTFLLSIKENGEDIFYNKDNQEKIKHNFYLTKEIYNPNHNLFLKYIVDFVNGKLKKT